MTKLRTKRCGVRFPSGARYFSFAVGPNQSAIQPALGVISLGVRRPPPVTSRLVVKLKVSAAISASPICLHGVYKNSFTVYFY
jgi:hypothetical protein